VAADGAGNAWAVWRIPGGVRGARLDAATGWQVPETLSGKDAGSPNDVAIASNAAGHTVVAWGETGGRGPAVRARVRGSTSSWLLGPMGGIDQ
jgi:hypothetical protein